MRGEGNVDLCLLASCWGLFVLSATCEKADKHALLEQCVLGRAHVVGEEIRVIP